MMNEREIAEALRKARELRDASWRSRIGYTKTQNDCIREVVGNAPIGKVLACLLTGGYCEMWEWADAILGTEEKVS